MGLLVVLVFLDHRCCELYTLYCVSMSSRLPHLQYMHIIMHVGSIWIIWIHAVINEDCNHAKNVEYDEVPILESKCLCDHDH